MRDTEEPDGRTCKDGWYYTTKEFAEIMDVPEATVRVWICRGIIRAESYYGRNYIPADGEFRFQRPWMTALRNNQLP